MTTMSDDGCAFCGSALRMSAERRRKAQVLWAWRRALRDWEQGKDLSPSNDDMVADALLVGAVLDGEILYDTLADGASLSVAYDAALKGPT